MEIVLLGTGAADGWPNPFCRCDSCVASLRGGQVRGQSAALVDDTLLIDCGPDALPAASRLGRTLTDVRTILITHDHTDHFGPQALLFRSWVADAAPIDVVGPADALDRARDWIGPDDPVTLRPVAPGDRITLSGYDIRVLRANHHVYRPGDSVLYDVTGPDNTRLLWATDTGPLPDDWFGEVAGARYDAAFLDTTFGDTKHSPGHHDLDEVLTTIGALRSVDAIGDGTDVVGVHLSHHHRSIEHVASTLLTVGARPGSDGDIITTGAPRATRELVLGGVRSGKSTYAETLCARFASVTYVATASNSDDDPDWVERLRLHRERRPASWTTIETHDVAKVLRSATEPVLIDCLGTWLAARADLHDLWSGDGRSDLDADIDELIATWSACPVPVIAVSNEVGSGIVPAAASGRLFRDLLGTINTRIASASDRVTVMTAGIPTRLR